MPVDWSVVAKALRRDANTEALGWQFGQDDALRWLADALEQRRSILIADEVGLGKTRLAVAAIHAVVAAGGQAAVVVPPTLLHQWESEHATLLAARQQHPAPNDAELRERRQLRAFLDAFPMGGQSLYPLSKGQPFVLISHGFGLSTHIGLHVGPYAWALPFVVRSFINNGVGNWQGVPGLMANAGDDRLNRQLPAACWLARDSRRKLRQELVNLPAFNLQAGHHFSVRNGDIATPERCLFGKLIGPLLGRFDLIVIDEAHKSRENGENDEQITKRLSFLIEKLLQKAPNCRRIGLTATPIQLRVEDWRGTLRRIGIEETDLNNRMKGIEAFEDVRARFRSGPASLADVVKICDAAEGFRKSLADVMMRRRWAEQPIMRQARDVFGGDSAHPHRRWSTATVRWSELSIVDRMAFLAKEGSSLASRKSPLAMVERHRAYRHGQAMDVCDGTEDQDNALPQAQGAEARRWRYWQKVQSQVQLQLPGAGLGDDALVTHPRLIASCAWIERVTESGGKVLVFASYNRPLRALTNALNVRRIPTRSGKRNTDQTTLCATRRRHPKHSPFFSRIARNA